MSLYLTLSGLFGGFLYYYHYYFNKDNLRPFFIKEFYLENSKSFVELDLDNLSEYLISIQYEVQDVFLNEYHIFNNGSMNGNSVTFNKKNFYVSVGICNGVDVGNGNYKLFSKDESCFGIVKIYKLD